MSHDQIKLRTPIKIPAGTYYSQLSPIITSSLPIVTFTTTDMDDNTVYNITKIYWENKDKISKDTKWGIGVKQQMLKNITTKIHPGAKKYYKEINIKLEAHH